MEGHEFCLVGGGGEAGLHRHHSADQQLIQRVTRLYRMAQFTVVLLLLLLSGALALLITVGLGGRCHVSPDGEVKVSPDSHSEDVNIEQGTERFQSNTDVQTPSAMLTAYRGNQIVGEYLQWEIGHCEGGFHYSNGDLVVPKDGFYRVFLQITYQSNGEHCPKAEMKLNNKVLCFTDSYPTDTPLLTSDDTVKCNKELWTKSLYTSGLFKLEANARLRVNATYPTFIARNNYEVFFGAERLP
ncbi:lymphotoxin-alpha-like [Acanthochromis polyacanthus]|uniref:lymphotoxin-alpha-like n=1 Tax=Acanthochromis polyacanthus TaxID=80966 RepID=UPI000B8F5691|nr:lymphotoxin-alpha-like [Acanthochromis polyacanthus]